LILAATAKLENSFYLWMRRLTGRNVTADATSDRNGTRHRVGFGQVAASRNLLPQIEAKFAPYDARPHWAKVFTMNTSQIAPLYPRIRDFRAFAHEFDPKGKFRHRYIRDHVEPA
jgi:hypothetical protein